MISTLGGIVYSNQNIPAVSSFHQDAQNRVTSQPFIMQELFREKDLEVEGVQEAKESFAVDPDKEHERSKDQLLDKEEEEQKEHKKAHDEPAAKEDSEKALVSTHLLDLKV